MKPTCMRSLAPSSRLYDAAVTAPRNRRRDECIGWILAGGGRGGGAGCASVKISRRWLTFGMLFRFPLPPKRSYCIVRSLNSYYQDTWDLERAQHSALSGQRSAFAGEP